MKKRGPGAGSPVSKTCEDGEQVRFLGRGGIFLCVSFCFLITSFTWFLTPGSQIEKYIWTGNFSHCYAAAGEGARQVVQAGAPGHINQTLPKQLLPTFRYIICLYCTCGLASDVGVRILWGCTSHKVRTSKHKFPEKNKYQIPLTLACFLVFKKKYKPHLTVGKIMHLY
jgi:hypothetical protein